MRVTLETLAAKGDWRRAPLAASLASPGSQIGIALQTRLAASLNPAPAGSAFHKCMKTEQDSTHHHTPTHLNASRNALKTEPDSLQCTHPRASRTRLKRCENRACASG